MTKNLSAEVMRKYTNILWKLDALKFDDRTKIDVWLKEGLVAEEQEKRRGNNYVR